MVGSILSPWSEVEADTECSPAGSSQSVCKPCGVPGGNLPAPCLLSLKASAEMSSLQGSSHPTGSCIETSQIPVHLPCQIQGSLHSVASWRLRIHSAAFKSLYGMQIFARISNCLCLPQMSGEGVWHEYFYKSSSPP